MTPAQAIYQAIDLLTRGADALREAYTHANADDCNADDWTGNEPAKTDYDHMLAVVDALQQALRNDIDGKAQCMDMVRTDLISMGIIDAGVAPMFIPEAVAGAIQKAVAAEREACAVISETGGGGKIICHMVATEIRKRAIKIEASKAKEPS